MANATTNLTSFSNTPQAKDDLFQAAGSEGSLEAGKVICLDVMANDLGGNAKTLYSVDDGTGSTSDILKDLATSDLLNGKAEIDGTTAKGANVLIVDGKVHIVTTDAYLQNNAINNLAAGEVFEDSFAYAIRMGNGTLSWARVTFTITGTNDGPVITSGVQKGGVMEDVTLTATGQVTSSDVDHGATASYSGDATSTYGSFEVDKVTGEWKYTLNNDASQALKAGEEKHETFTVTVTDDQGGEATQDVVITITGTNDDPKITSEAQAGSVTEDGTLSATGKVTSSDVDHDATASYSGNATTDYGSFVVGNDGAWTYTLDNTSSKVQALGAGETHDETFTVTVTDDHGATDSQDVKITITGSYDAPPMPPFTGDSFETHDLSGWEHIGNVNVVGASSAGGSSVGPTDGAYFAALSTDLTRNGSGASQADIETSLGIQANALDHLGNGNAVNGAAMWKTIHLDAGDKLQFKFRFDTTETSSNKDDFGFLSVAQDGTLEVLADVSSVGSTTDSGWKSFLYEADTDGDYTIGFGVMDAGGDTRPSFLYLDDLLIA